ncbi:hypothetical protein Ais01nite_19600 [Asanoa ishikariensis]|uniref:TgtA5 cluster protein 2 n=1 Tax=Asanoa ishikariensis TaxID=137265 RepID=A0A1H3UC85_9ACTN|nr:hypothetical protein [Asanoa ishikariensis]GIF63925.1 hypothetical protein Ais01nite_19600 [Asanoa ishikariensis]SDZ59651.1 hypothetical protein SAMN05421684_6915 [Asanoa ishikariensis]
MSNAASVISPIHVIVTCANRKTAAVPDELRLGGLKVHSAQQRFPVWAERLATTDCPRVPAIDLYAGEHWHGARALRQTLSSAANLWVCSAGYGLVAADAPLAPYAATFAPGADDSAGSSPTEMREWWRQLTRWNWSAEAGPRSFADLARQNPQGVIIAVLSESYMRACSDDLREAVACLNDREQFAIFGPPNRCTELDEFVVPVTGALRPVVGGSMQALNVRAANHLLRAAGDRFSYSALCKLAQEATEAAAPDPGRRPAGQKLGDDEVREYIRRALAEGRSSATGLLRRLRASGQSCEQARFHALFAAIAGEVQG